MKKTQSLYEIFKNPETKYRPIPFWSWNDDLEEVELKRQIDEMKEAGFGGFYMHSRPGLKIPYLKERWMELVDFAVKEGRKAGLEPWLYDEDKWPSGFGSGDIPKNHPETRFRYLVCIASKYYESFLKDDLQKQLVQSKEHSFFLNQFSKENLIAINEIDGVSYSFYEWIAPLGDKWYNDACFTDLMNPETVDIFIDYVYEEYKKHFGPLFGNQIPGIFTDEPCFFYWAKIPFPRLPWTKNLIEKFQQKNGYDLKEHLISLIEDVGDFKKIRYDYYKTISNLFLESYAIKLYNWCKNNDLIFTGHYQMEDDLPQQIDAVGEMMPLYEYEDYPGIDILGDRIGVHGSYLTIKQCSSVADQLSKKRVMSETYGGAGWHLSLADQKKMAEIQLALGVNYFVPHLLLYSLLGERKRDHPPSIYYQQPYWDQYRMVNDYISRLSALLAQGTREVNILMIHPIESAWIEYKPQDWSAVNKRNEEFQEILNFLVENQKDLHLGDETLLSKYGKVENGKLLVGTSSYDYVILPQLETIRKSTLKLLEEFAASGGQIYCIDEFPKLIDCKETTNINFGYKIITKKELYSDVHELLPQSIKFSGNSSNRVLSHVRKYNGKEIIYILNCGDQSARGALEFKTENKTIELWDPLDGKKCKQVYQFTGEKTVIPLQLYPGESKLFVTLNENLQETGITEIPPTSEKEIVLISGDWKISSMTPNSLTLDFCQYRIENDGYSKIMPVLEVQEKIQKLNGKKLSLKYEFELEIPPSFIKEMYLIAEYREDVTVKLNGVQLNFNKNEWWLDISFKKININELIRDGVNLVEYETIIKSDTELESMYLLGDFTLKSYTDRIFSIIGKDNNINITDLTKCGYQFFTGKMSVSKHVNIDKKNYKKITFKLDKLDAALVNLYVNEKFVGTLAWNPLELDITKFIKKGINEIKLELVSTCRNLLGPHHLKRPEPMFINPDSFFDKKKWDNTYYFVPFGIPCVPEIILY
jgi:hypothetical protein